MLHTKLGKVPQLTLVDGVKGDDWVGLGNNAEDGCLGTLLQ